MLPNNQWVAQAFDIKNIKTPRVLMIDSDETIDSSITSLPYNHDIIHPRFVHHQFDVNTKKHVQSDVQSVNGAHLSYQLIHECSICRELGYEDQLNYVWILLLSTGLDEKHGCQNSIKYLNNNRRVNRRKWATCFFQKIFAMRYSTINVQRAGIEF